MKAADGIREEMEGHEEPDEPVVEDRQRVLHANNQSDDCGGHHKEDAKVRMENKPRATGMDVEGSSLLEKEAGAEG